jgi:hypothetical protein
LFAGLRGDVGVDTQAYRTFFDELTSAPEGHLFEPMFVFLSTLGHAIGASSQFLIFTVAMLQGLLMFVLARQVKESDVLYLGIVGTFFVYVNLNLIRVGLALYVMGLALLAVRNGRAKTGQALFVTAVMTHFSIVLMAPAIWRRWYRLVPFALLFTALTWGTLSQKLIDYFLEGNLFTTHFSIGIGFLATTALLVLIIHWEKLWSDRVIVASFACSTVFKVAGFLIPILDRISLVFSFALVVVLTSVLRLQRSRIAILCIALYGAYASLVFVATSDQAMDDLIYEFPGLATLYSETRWVPYRFYWEH